jgi:voltage-gated potassium channel Kch
MILIDILAVLALFPELRGLRALRLLRLLRTSRVFRYRNPFAIVLQTLEENGLLFAFAFSVLGVATLLGGVSLYLVEARPNPSLNTILDGIWWALVTITTVGFGDITPVTALGRIIGGVMMIAGMFTLALFAGIVGSSLVRGVLAIREEQFRMSDYVNHIVVCGYDESTDLLLDALRQSIDVAETRVVFFDDHDRPRELPPDFLWVQGDPTKESELDKVRLTHAAAVIVTGERDTSPQNADARTILTVFTIRAFLSKPGKRVRKRRFPVYVVAEILDSENVNHARQAGADEVIETRKIGYSMIAHAVRFHGTATSMSRVLLSGAHNVYVGQVPETRREPIAFGDLLVKMQLSKRGGLVIGLRTPAGEEIINPAKSHVLEPGTMLIYLSEKPLLEPPP